jgi:hypothetical protein
LSLFTESDFDAPLCTLAGAACALNVLLVVIVLKASSPRPKARSAGARLVRIFQIFEVFFAVRTRENSEIYQQVGQLAAS